MSEHCMMPLNFYISINRAHIFPPSVLKRIYILVLFIFRATMKSTRKLSYLTQKKVINLKLCALGSQSNVFFFPIQIFKKHNLQNVETEKTRNLSFHFNFIRNIWCKSFEQYKDTREEPGCLLCDHANLILLAIPQNTDERSN